MAERLGGGRRLSLRRVRRGRRFSTQHFELDLRQLRPLALTHLEREALPCRQRVRLVVLEGRLRAVRAEAELERGTAAVRQLSDGGDWAYPHL